MTMAWSSPRRPTPAAASGSCATPPASKARSSGRRTIRTSQLNRKNGRRTKIANCYVIAFLLAFMLPVAARAGHGVEDTVDNLPAERIKQLMDAGEKLVFIDMRPTKEFQQNR